MSLCSACGMPAKKCLIFAFVVTGATFFVLGAHFQHNLAVLYFHQLIQKDPYAFFIRDKIYGAFALFPIDLENLLHTDPTRTPMARIMKYGFPGMDCLIPYSDFMLSFDRRNRVAHWVYEHVTPESINSQAMNLGRRYASYQPEMRVASYFRSDNEDYWKSGYDRGHLAASGNHRRTQSHCNETFFMTNIAPQVGKGFNRDAWHNLELYVRNLAEVHGSVYVCTGPLYLPQEYQISRPEPSETKSYNNRLMIEYKIIGEHSVAVPTHFFKVLIIESNFESAAPRMEAFIMPNKPHNDDVDLSIFLCDIREVERAAGLKFYRGLREKLFVD